MIKRARIVEIEYMIRGQRCTDGVEMVLIRVAEEKLTGVAGVWF